MTVTSIGTPAETLTAGAGHARTVSQYLEELAAHAARMDVRDVADFTALVVDTLRGGNAVFVVGNGGSASTAGHMTCDWTNACARANLPHANVVNLAEGVATLTALANDIAYEEVFSRQLALRGKPGDLLVLLSVSGNSPNLLEAARHAQLSGMKVAGLLGNSGALGPYCDALSVFGGGDYGLTEDLHLAVNHIVVRALAGGAPLRYPHGRDAG
jgi:D-sedoheptulose 7-phosphate isomerase